MTQMTLGQFTGEIHFCASENAYSGLTPDTNSLYLVPAKTVPTSTSQLTNDSGFITSSGSITGNAATATEAANYSASGTIASALLSKLDATKCTFQTTEPTAAITDNGVHIVYLTAEPATKYAGYIYMIQESS